MKFRKKYYAWFVIFCFACASSKIRQVEESSLVRVAIVKLVNASRQANYDYLSESLTGAAQSSMDKKFFYFPIAADKTRELAEAIEKKNGIPDNSELRSHALSIDADLVIYGFFKTTLGKKGDLADITFSIFRTDNSAVIGNLNRKALISGTIFKDIDAIAGELVRQIGEYRKSQSADAGKKETAGAAGEKIHLTRDSLNMLPFIPPVF